jgi:hypothetical protein
MSDIATKTTDCRIKTAILFHVVALANLFLSTMGLICTTYDANLTRCDAHPEDTPLLRAQIYGGSVTTTLITVLALVAFNVPHWTLRYYVVDVDDDDVTPVRHVDGPCRHLFIKQVLHMIPFLITLILYVTRCVTVLYNGVPLLDQCYKRREMADDDDRSLGLYIFLSQFVTYGATLYCIFIYVVVTLYNKSFI